MAIVPLLHDSFWVEKGQFQQGNPNWTPDTGRDNIVTPTTLEHVMVWGLRGLQIGPFELVLETGDRHTLAVSMKGQPIGDII